MVLGLDRDDTIVRRRLRQKVEFLSEDMMGVPEPSEEDLRRFLESHSFEMLPEDEVAKLFGHEFAAQLLKLGPNTWTGPAESGYGLHLVFIHERVVGRTPELSEVREAVRREWLAAQRSKAQETFYRRLRDRYTVSVELPDRLVGIVQIKETK